MKEIKEIKYEVTVRNQLFKVFLTYGLEHSTQHKLEVQIIHVENPKTGKQKVVVDQDITDLLHKPDIYSEKVRTIEDSIKTIQNLVMELIEITLDSEETKKEVAEILDIIEKNNTTQS